MRVLILMSVILLVPAGATGQTVVELDMPSAAKLLGNHGMARGVSFLSKLANNYKKLTNVRVHSSWYEESIATLARALRTDFDGSGAGYVADVTVWKVHGSTGSVVYLVASLVDSDAILLSSDLFTIKGMIAYEILEGIRRGTMNVREAQRKALAAGIEMQVSESFEGERSITFFGHGDRDDKIVGRLVVIEPPDLVWN